MFSLRPLSALLAGSRTLLAVANRPLLAPSTAVTRAAVASSSAHQSRSVAWLPHGKNKSKSTRYQTMLKAKRRRQRRGKTGGPRKDVKSLSTFVGFRKEITFLPRKLGFNNAMLKDDPALVVPIETPVLSKAAATFASPAPDQANVASAPTTPAAASSSA